ncbi:uncharacterized protein LOC106075259 isoform X1 [Biomphalaria glabrata]|uniref:Uncharacterized protein LOC106075259 isoform X1 n=1 Tax=Biomphalaria glabrata TaxID=6526 RepID=A0A9W3BGK4_BIOGL|nr:uncharacterized protein LOC106075259 isoform X1 [Biomphalaria glabrata]XP_055898680.1 uncharacterized protein LOC106075259 isoform X1 [Biomphalaria glabrata]XP_055898681.1 uncharacterized protein LOC106075259 isoform X1 [Biomphalaria glabrata]XP_055898683.1 uncharacterized protein LOC106075259 isoform X1 [Biomphalaria glabrata]XP_055898684.1 uncharacterized protein LOC106075259 isoform X1 [Biomphalaria glabrata]XP_055898685.1 uncharacterized protein LOC106075259 isoform X1 [Biomphalaria gla
MTPTKWKRGRMIGSGGFGKVYKCFDANSNRVFAVKYVEFEVQSHLVQAEFQALSNEIKILEGVKHERIVQCYGCRSTPDALAIFLEYIPGGSLFDHIREFGACSEHITQHYTLQILQGLTYLHGNKIVHRDIKAANILRVDNGNIKLADFGLSKQLDDISAAKGLKTKQVGTPYWMAPELLKQKGEYGQNVDLWSVGCTVVEMLTKEPPFIKYPPIMAVHRIINCDHPRYMLPAGSSTHLQDFLKITFKVYSVDRTSAAELLKHPFVAECHSNYETNPKQEIDHWKKEKDELLKALHNQKDQTSRLQYKIDQLMKKNKDLEDTIEQIRKEKAELSKSLQIEKDENCKLKEKVAELSNCLHMEQNENCRLKEKLAVYEKKCTSNEEKIEKETIIPQKRKRTLSPQLLATTKDFLCKVTGALETPCSSTCPHVIGQHENQISQSGEGDLHRYMKTCTKNPGHAGFIPVVKFSLDDLPATHREENLLKFIKAAADLTVRINVTMTSQHRPEYWPTSNVPYFLYNLRESQHLRTGSGIIHGVEKNTQGPCPCCKCKHSSQASNVWWKLNVVTAATLVFDDIEASNATLRLFYDREYSPLLILKDNLSVEKKDIMSDRSLLRCVTCDKKLGEKLEKMLASYLCIKKKVLDRYSEYRNVHKLMFIVSHPHGCSKHVSIGQWLNVYTLANGKYKFTYHTGTCPGSSGASVHYIGFGTYVHCGSLTSGLNYSSS